MLFPFINREKEMRVLERLANAPPDVLYVVYGPVNSGKSELIRHFIKKKMIEGRKTYCVNFRLKSVMSYEDVVEALMEEVKSEELLKTVKELTGTEGEHKYAEWSRMVGMSGVFNYWIRDLRKHSNGKAPIAVFDSIEKLKSINGNNGLVFYEIMNFGIGISKEEHLAHVFVVSNNSMLIEKIHVNPELNPYVEYIRVDDLEEETVRKFLKSQGFEDEQVDKIIGTLGTKPSYVVRATLHKDDLDEYLENVSNVRTDQVFQMLNALRLGNPDLHEEVMEILQRIVKIDEMGYSALDDPLRWLVDTNILFLDPISRKVKFQGKLEKVAAEEYLKLREENGATSPAAQRRLR